MKKINIKSISLQTGIIAALLLLFIFFGNSYVENINKRNIGIGFGFLDDTAGFSISQTLIDYDESDTFGRTFVIGLLNTILASVISILLATILGFVITSYSIHYTKLYELTE